MSKKVIIVGNQFEAFANEDNVVTLKHFESSCGTGAFENVQIQTGLGMPHSKLHDLASDNLSIEAPSGPAPLKITHKLHDDNVMISTPLEDGEGKYYMDLILNDGSDRLLDHVTGSHVSGMVLVEAARQASIACTEIQYDFQNQSIPSSFLWTGMNVQFSQFVFPVATRIKLQIRELESSSKKKISLISRVSFIQGENVASEMDMMFDVLPKKSINLIETRSATSLIRQITAITSSEPSLAEA